MSKKPGRVFVLPQIICLKEKQMNNRMHATRDLDESSRAEGKHNGNGGRKIEV